MRIGAFPALLVYFGMSAWAELVPGAWEPFTTETNVNAWGLEDFAEPGVPYAPTWTGGENPFAESYMIEDGIAIYADDLVGDGAFIGDYAAAEVESVEMYVYLKNPQQVDFLEFTLRGGDGRYYYTESYYGTEFKPPEEEEEPFYLMEFFLDDLWFYWAGEWVEVELTPEILSDITEIGINFYPVEDNATETIVGIDDVRLKHRLYPAALTAAVAGTMVELSFPTRPAHWYVLEEFDVATAEWKTVDGQDFIFGPDPFVFSFPAGDGGLFRAVADHDYIEIVTTPGL